MENVESLDRMLARCHISHFSEPRQVKPEVFFPNCYYIVFDKYCLIFRVGSVQTSYRKAVGVGRGGVGKGGWRGGDGQGSILDFLEKEF